MDLNQKLIITFTFLSVGLFIGIATGIVIGYKIF